MRYSVMSVLVASTVLSVMPQARTEQSNGAGQTPTTLPAVLRCAHDALGGHATVTAVNALRWTSETRPAPGVSGPVPSRFETAFVLPNRYRRWNQPLSGGLPASIIGMDGATILSGLVGWSAPDDDAARTLGTARHTFARDVLAWLVRPLPAADVTLSFAGLRRDDGDERLVIRAAGEGGFDATLLLDSRSCEPVALLYERPANMADVMRERRRVGAASGGPAELAASASGQTRLERVDLEDYRSFGGIRFPTMLRRSTGGQPDVEERVTDVQVNPELPGDYFTPARR
jgi:hypothetical protein